MIEAEADHAILSTYKLPDEAQQVHITPEGVIVANPAQVVALVDLLRHHMIKIAALQIATPERDRRAAAFYDYIMSERGQQLLRSFDDNANKLRTIDTDEQKAHKKVWTKRNQLIMSQRLLLRCSREYQAQVKNGRPRQPFAEMRYCVTRFPESRSKLGTVFERVGILAGFDLYKYPVNVNLL